MAPRDMDNCELPSEKYYRELHNYTQGTTYKNLCDSNDYILSGENPISKNSDLKDFCYKFASNIENLKNKKNESSFDMKKHCTHLQFWLQYNVISITEKKSTITCISLIHSIWENIKNNLEDSIKNSCTIKLPPVSIGYREKWKKMHDYIYNYEQLKCAFKTEEGCNGDFKENCRDYYCKYILDIFNIYNEFEHVCNGENRERCPDFWNEFKNKYLETSDIESKCKDVYDKLGFYKVKMYWGEQDIEKYIEQYESEHIFSFFEKLIGYSIKYYLSKTIYYSKYILSFFGSKISPRVDDMRKMWRNVQGVTNPASLLNPGKPPSGGNKMGLPYMPM
ncbi:PIR protein [Plasmodium ovale]|uniref:PIR protein n=1 Tax=Plasmodium ovale TaxID=36330 RepID=A0A1D3JCP0_PLAOA|nr:PIR protein [Plasmodium ovale]